MRESVSVARLNADQAAIIALLAASNLEARLAAPPRRPLHPHQIPPTGDDWAIWLLLGGRGSGKTEAGSRYVDDHARGPACIEGPVPHRIAIVAPSHDDAVDTCVRGETGILQVNRNIHFAPGAQLRADLTWRNGAEAKLFGTFNPEDVERFRGPQHCLIWWDEFAASRKLDACWDMVEFGLRLGQHPRMILTTTPKRRPKLKEVLSRPDTVVSRAKTSDNPDLPAIRRAKLYERYAGTVLGRQELDAEIIEDMPGALWNRVMIQYGPTPKKLHQGQPVVDFVRVVVAVDPAVTSGEDSDETGIIVDALGGDGKGYTLADRSCREQPHEWARRVVAAYHEFKADRIVAEANNGGDLVSTVIRTIDPNVPVTLVHASRGKRTRAEPVAALYEQGRWIHVSPFPELEDQQCSYIGEEGDDSPDRMDAHVWGATELFGLTPKSSQWGGGREWGSAA